MEGTRNTSKDFVEKLEKRRKCEVDCREVDGWECENKKLK
jgi:hypothetical protein